MSDRWVCKRCFADNEATDSACVRCGLLRGADATESDQATWASQPGTATTRRSPDWQRWLGYLWIPVVIAVVGGGFLFSARRGDDGSLTSAGNVSITDLRAGDCFNTIEDELIAEVDGVPCTEAHRYEVFELATWEGDGTFPADSQLDAIFVEICEPEFAPYVGEPYQTSTIYGSMITPSDESWSDGDRAFACLLFDPEQPQLTESLRDANR